MSLFMAKQCVLSCLGLCIQRHAWIYLLSKGGFLLLMINVCIHIWLYLTYIVYKFVHNILGWSHDIGEVPSFIDKKVDQDQTIQMCHAHALSKLLIINAVMSVTNSSDVRWSWRFVPSFIWLVGTSILVSPFGHFFFVTVGIPFVRVRRVHTTPTNVSHSKTGSPVEVEVQ